MARRSDQTPQRRDPPVERLHLWQFQAVRDLLVVAGAAGFIWLGHALRAVTVPLLVALLLAYLFEPIVARLSRHPRVSRPLVVGGLLATLGIALVALLAVLIPAGVNQTAALVEDYQVGRFRATAAKLVDRLPESLQERAEGLLEYLPAGAGATPSGPDEGAGRPVLRAGPSVTDEQEIRALVRDELARARQEEREGGSSRWLGMARGGVKAAGAVLAGIIELGFLAFLIPFYFFFFSVWYPSVVRFGGSLIPDSNRSRTVELLGKMDDVVAGFVRGRIVVSLIMGAMLAVGWLACGVPYSIVLGFVVGLFCAVPYLGGVGVPVAVALLAFKELGAPEDEAMSWWGVILWPSLVFGVVQVIEGYVLIPLIAGKATKLDPVTILVAVLAGGSIAGVYGMLLGIPVAACLKIVGTDIVLPKVRAWTSGEAADPLPID